MGVLERFVRNNSNSFNSVVATEVHISCFLVDRYSCMRPSVSFRFHIRVRFMRVVGAVRAGEAKLRVGARPPSCLSLETSNLVHKPPILHTNLQSCIQTCNLAYKPPILHINVQSCIQASDLAYKPLILHTNLQSCT